ncbi:hypothetical protein [Listeria rocourtiae]|uniref:hypothetical protein n=1 Tax=Listeria rocourtiae TaxID=647910 RepID=UPI003D2F73C7
MNNVSITNNIIANVPLSAIYLGRLDNNDTSKVSELRSINISQNILTNCAYATHVSSQVSFIDIRGNILGASVEGNLMNDQFETEKTKYSIRLTPKIGKDIRIRNNLLTTKQADTQIKMLIAAGYQDSVKE